MSGDGGAEDAPPPQFSLWVTEGSLLGVDAAGNDVAVAVRKGERLDIDENGAAEGVVKWVGFRRELTGCVSHSIVNIKAGPTAIPDVRMRDDQYMVLVKHKSVHIAAGAQVKTLVLKPGSTVTKEDIIALLNFSPSENFTVENTQLPIHYDTVTNETTLRIILLEKTVLIERDPVLYNLEGPRIVSLQIGRGYTLRDIVKEAGVLFPGPRFDLYDEEGKRIDDKSFEGIKDGARLKHICRPKVIKIQMEDGETMEVLVDSRKRISELVAMVSEAMGVEPGEWVLRDIVENKEMMPSWNAVENNGKYRIVKTDKRLSITGFGGVMEDFCIGTASEPVYDVEAAFSLQNQFFTFSKRAEPPPGEDFYLSLTPLTIKIVTFAGTTDVSITQEDPTHEVTQQISNLTQLPPTDWDLCYSASAPPLAKPYHYSQFTRSGRKYHVVCRTKQIVVVYKRETEVEVPVGVNHQEMLKKLKRDLMITEPVEAFCKGEKKDLSWVKVKEGDRVELVERVKCVAVQKEEGWPHDVAGGAHEMTIEVGCKQGAEETWEKIVDVFDLKNVSKELNILPGSCYLTSTSSDEPIANLSYCTMRHDSVLVLCLPRKKINLVSTTHDDNDGLLTIYPGESHEAVLKRIEQKLYLHRKYRLLGPYPTRAAALDVAAASRKNQRLVPNCLSYQNTPENSLNQFLVCPPKILSFTSYPEGTTETIYVSFTNTFAEILDSVTQTFGSSTPPSHIETEDGEKVDSITYFTANSLVSYVVHWHRK